MYLGDNLRYLRRKFRMTQNELARNLGYRSYTTVQKWEEGTSSPPLEIIAEMAKLFNVEIEELISCRIYAGEAFRTKGSSYRVAVLGRVAAGEPIEAVENVLGHEEIPADLAETGDFFALKISGSSMAPRIQEDDIVIVRRQETVENNEIAIVIVGDTDATCKKVKRTGDGILLIPINPGYDPIFFTNKDAETLPVRIIGKAVELRGKL